MRVYDKESSKKHKHMCVYQQFERDPYFIVV